MRSSLVGVLVCASCGHANSEGAKFCEECGFSFAAMPAGAKEQRKTVTVLFCDLTGSTALGETLDPERLRALLARYFERMKTVVERHGGSVEKFVGDAVMAVFGVPVLHEDDALRALRAAAEMREALPELGLEGRIGVMTGEVVTGTEERLATGDAVNVAARLEQAAEPGEVLIGAPTLALAGDAAEVEPVEPLVLNGKAELVAAYRPLNVAASAERPLVVVFDDIQWGEETFLDLIEHVALLSSGAAILLFCIARPELSERRPAWPVTFRLEPLGDEDVDELIPERLPGELRAKITRAAGGNPLFI